MCKTVDYNCEFWCHLINKQSRNKRLMSLTISELSVCFAHCHCLPQFIVFKRFQRIKMCHYHPGHSASEEMNEYCCDTEENALFLFFLVSSQKFPFVITNY